MPLLRVTHTKGAFSQSQRDQLADAFTHCILIAEIGSDNETARQTAYVQFVELDPASGGWYVGGKREECPPKGGRLILDIFYPFGATNQILKSQLHRELADVIGITLGVDVTFQNRVGDWVFIHEVPEGCWGVSGVTIGVEAIHAASGGDPDRVPQIRATLAASSRLQKQFAFPDAPAMTS